MVEIVEFDGYQAELVPYPADWMAGRIDGGANALSTEDATEAVLANIRKVGESELPYTSCTDGRWRNRTIDNEPATRRQQLVGASAVSGFVAAEALGEAFYPPEVLEGTVSARLRYTYKFMNERDEKPSTYVHNKIAEGLVHFMQDEHKFASNDNFRDRLRHIMPAGRYDNDVYHEYVQHRITYLARGRLRDLRGDSIMSAVRDLRNSHAIEELSATGPGPLGHREQLVAIVDQTVEGVAIAQNDLLATDDVQVYALSGERVERLATMMAGGDPESMEARIASHAIWSFSATVHGQRGKALPTIVITRAA